MELHELKPAKGAVKKAKRLGKGEASGKGGTSTKGTKGQQARTGYKSKVGHEGGQMPIQRRLPKRGFKNNNRINYHVFNIGQLDELISKYKLEAVTLENLYVNGLVSRTDHVKILGEGELKTKIDIKVNAVSAKARKAIEGVGGTIELV